MSKFLPTNPENQEFCDALDTLLGEQKREILKTLDPRVIGVAFSPTGQEDFWGKYLGVRLCIRVQVTPKNRAEFYFCGRQIDMSAPFLMAPGNATEAGMLYVLREVLRQGTPSVDRKHLSLSSLPAPTDDECKEKALSFLRRAWLRGEDMAAFQAEYRFAKEAMGALLRGDE